MSATSAIKKRKASSGSNNDTRSTSPAPTTPSHVYAVTSRETDSDGTTRKLEALYTDVANANEAARRIHNNGHARLGDVSAEWMRKAIPEAKNIEAGGLESSSLPEPEDEVEISGTEGWAYCARLRGDGGMRFGGATGRGDAWVVWVERVDVDLPLPVEEETEVQDEPAYAYEDEEEEEEEDLYEDMDRPWH